VENLPPMPFLFCSNHSSHMDSIVLMAASGRGFGLFGLLAASDYFFRSPLQSQFFSCLVKLIPISRTPTRESLEQTMAECRRFLAEGERSLILFPEGTRSRNGAMREFKRGAGMLSVRLGLPIVPAYIEGSGAAMPKGRFFPAPSPVTVRIGSPIFPRENASHAGGRVYDDIVLEARRRIEAMKGPGHAR
jgi:long-chain acyl-CoA synthetase